MSEATIGGLVILAVLGLVIAWALVRGGARCDGYTDDWRADGDRQTLMSLRGIAPDALKGEASEDYVRRVRDEQWPTNRLTDIAEKQ